MDIDSLTIAEARELARMFAGIAAPTDTAAYWPIGKPIFIRTVTHHLTGRLVAVTPQEIILEDAAWIADDGRFAQAVENGEFSEVEPFPSGRRLIVGRGSLIDATEIPGIPRSQK
jgi:hypothetical protein